MEINKNNYAEYFLDYFEGKLNEEQQSMVFQFLESHPELKEEFNSFEIISFNADENIKFNDKNSLIRPEVDHHNVEHYLIAQAEGDITDNENRALESFLDIHPEYKKDQKIISQLKIQPEEIKFNYKQNLKKEIKKPAGKIIYLYRTLAVAASVVLVLFFYLTNNKDHSQQQVANKNEVIKQDKPGNVKHDNDENNSRQIAQDASPDEKLSSNSTEVEIQKEERIKKTPVKSMEQEIKPSPEIVQVIPAETIKPEIVNQISNNADVPLIEIAEQKVENKNTTQPENTDMTLAQVAINTVGKFINPEQTEQERNNSASVVERAATGLNKLTGKDVINFEKQYNEEGNLKKFTITAGNFGFSRSKSR